MISRLTRGLAALAGLATLIAGLPWALVRYGSWPFHTLPNRTWLDHLNDTVSDRALLAALTVSVWVIWVAFTYAVVIEMAAAARGIRPPKIHLLGPVQHAAHGLVAALILALSIQHVVSAAAAFAVTPNVGYVPPLARVAVVEPARPFKSTAPASSPSPTASQTATKLTAEPAASSTTVTVKRGDSAWSLAERYLDDGMRWREIWDLNRRTLQTDGRTWNDPQVLVEGWNLHIPGGVPNAEPVEDRSNAFTHTYTVVSGDTLSDIARDELGNENRYQEIYDASSEVDQPEHRHLTDPNLILPGWTLIVPGATQETPPPLEPSTAPTDTTPVAISPEPPAETEPSTTQVTANAPSSVQMTGETPSTTIADVLVAAASNESPSTWPPPAPAMTFDNGQSSRHPLGILLGAGGSLVLASALSVRMSRLRRARLSRGLRDKRIVEENADSISKVVRAADVPFVKWAGHELSALAHLLKPADVTGRPEAVELSQAAGIEILWDRKQPAPPAPWTAADGGSAWRLAYDEDAATPANDRCSAFPALVTIGKRSGRQLLLDLEAYGTIAVTGPDDQVDAFLRSIAIELATGEDISNAYLDVVGFDLPAGHYGPRIRHTDIDEAASYLQAFAYSVVESITALGHTDTFTARLGDAPPIEASIVIVGRTTDATKLMSTPRHAGVAVMAAGNYENANAHIRLNKDGSAFLEPLHLEFIAASITADAAETFDKTLAELDELLDPPRTQTPDPDDIEASEQSEDGSVSADATEVLALPFEGEADGDCGWPEIFVKILGAPGVPARPTMKRRETIMTVVLACHGKPLPVSMVQDALYGEKGTEAKTVQNVVTNTRKMLGKFTDGTAVMPNNNKHQGKLALDERVTTDMAILRSATEHARELSTVEALMVLERAHRLIDGPPFDDSGYTWAYDHHFVAEAERVVIEATTELIDRALEADLPDIAHHALLRGFRAVRSDEALYRAKMKIEHHAGNLPGVKSAYDELSAELATFDTEPSKATDDLYHRLTGKGSP